MMSNKARQLITAVVMYEELAERANDLAQANRGAAAAAARDASHSYLTEAQRHAGAILGGDYE